MALKNKTSPSARWSRRQILKTGAVVPAVLTSGAVSSGIAQARYSQKTGSTIYDELGVRPFINAAGTYTALSASLILPEVAEAMTQASRSFVSIGELQRACGERLAKLVGAESALVTSGCAAALTAATAACVCGDDPERIRRAPELDGSKDEVILMKSHRVSYDHAIRSVGARLVEVESLEAMERALNHRTAMLFFLNFANDLGFMDRKAFVAFGRRVGIPTLIDAAADLPPAANLSAFIELGFDLVAFSGGKGLRGPQCSGFLLGRKHLIDASYKNGSPHSDSIARASKVGKEEIVGLTRAVEIYLARDHQADWAEWENRVSIMVEVVADIPGVTGERFVPHIANAVPHVSITWDRRRVDLTRDDVARALRTGEPRIEVRPSEGSASRLEIGVWMMEPGDIEVVAERCRRVLAGAA